MIVLCQSHYEYHRKIMVTWQMLGVQLTPAVKAKAHLLRVVIISSFDWVYIATYQTFLGMI